MLIRTHVVDPVAHCAQELPPVEGNRLAEALERLRSLAKNVMESELSMAMGRQVRAELDAWIHRGQG